MVRDRRQGWGKEDEKGAVSRRWGQGLGREPGRGPRPLCSAALGTQAKEVLIQDGFLEEVPLISV